MADGDKKTLAIKTYLGQLPVKVQERLLKSVEAAAEAAPSPETEVILKLLREVVREKETQIQRYGTPMRGFWEFIDPLFVDAPDNRKQTGRIPRSTLQPIWTWLNAELLPTHLPDLVDHAKKRLAEDDTQGSQALIAQAKSLLRPVLSRAIDMCRDNKQFRSGLAERLGGANALAHLSDIWSALETEADIDVFKEEFPGLISSPSNAKIRSLLELVQPIVEAKPNHAHIYLALVQPRFQNPAAALSLAVMATDSDQADVLSSSPYAILGDLLLFEIALKAKAIVADLDGSKLDDQILDRVEALVREMKSFQAEVNLDPNHEWAEKLSDVRIQLCTVLSQELLKVSKVARALFAPLEQNPVVALSDEKKTDFDVLMRLASAGDSVRSDLGLADAALEATIKVEAILDQVGTSVVPKIRSANIDERELIMEYMYAAVDYVQVLQGQDAARVVRRLAEAAYSDSQTRDKTAA